MLGAGASAHQTDRGVFAVLVYVSKQFILRVIMMP